MSSVCDWCYVPRHDEALLLLVRHVVGYQTFQDTLRDLLAIAPCNGREWPLPNRYLHLVQPLMFHPVALIHRNQRLILCVCVYYYGFSVEVISVISPYFPRFYSQIFSTFPFLRTSSLLLWRISNQHNQYCTACSFMSGRKKKRSVSVLNT